MPALREDEIGRACAAVPVQEKSCVDAEMPGLQFEDGDADGKKGLWYV